MLNFSKNFLFFMSIISHIVNHLNSLIQCRTISVDLTSNILRQKIVEVHSYSLAYEIVQNWSATIISDCQKFFGFLPIIYQIDIRTARFLETFMISDNGICMLFERHAKIGRNKIFSTYIRWRPFSVRLEMCRWWTLLLLVTVSIVINSSYCLEVAFLLNSLFTCELRLFCFRFYLVKIKICICCCCHLANKAVYAPHT